MQSELIQLIDNQIAELEKNKALVMRNAQRVVSEYWSYFNEENTKISNLRSSGLTKQHVSTIAPVMEVKRSKTKGGHSEFVYIVWKSHSPKFRKNIQKKGGRQNKNGKAVNPSLPIHSYASRNIDNILSNRCTWNKTRALETEQIFRTMRITISGIQKAVSKLRYTKRALEQSQPQRISEQQENHHAS